MTLADRPVLKDQGNGQKFVATYRTLGGAVQGQGHWGGRIWDRIHEHFLI